MPHNKYIKYINGVNPHGLVFDALYINEKFRKGKSVLQLGGCPKIHHSSNWIESFKCFALYGYRIFDLLDIADYLRNLDYELIRKKIQGNILNIDNLINQKYDIIFWYRGPEHMEKANVKKIIPKLMKHINVALVVGTPLGYMSEKASYNNPYNEHISHWEPGEWFDLNFDTYVCTEPHKGIVAIKWHE